jgi:hypothetical protein
MATQPVSGSTLKNQRWAMSMRAKRQAVATQRKPTWEENIDDPLQFAPYGIRWGKSVKSSNIHIMEWGKYAGTFRTRCSKTNQARILPTNAYIKANLCMSCSRWLHGVMRKAVEKDWNHFTDPTTGRTKRERHN